jgi:hypothetical protein
MLRPGRPRRSDPAPEPLVALYIRVPVPMAEAVRGIAQRRGVTVSDVVREAIERMIRERGAGNGDV